MQQNLWCAIFELMYRKLQFVPTTAKHLWRQESSFDEWFLTHTLLANLRALQVCISFWNTILWKLCPLLINFAANNGFSDCQQSNCLGIAVPFVLTSIWFWTVRWRKQSSGWCRSVWRIFSSIRQIVCFQRVTKCFLQGGPTGLKLHFTNSKQRKNRFSTYN